MSTSNVVIGAPCATAASPPTSTNCTPEPASRSSSVVRSLGSVIGTAGGLGHGRSQDECHADHAVVLTEPLPHRKRQQLVYERLVYQDVRILRIGGVLRRSRGRVKLRVLQAVLLAGSVIKRDGVEDEDQGHAQAHAGGQVGTA